METESSYIFPYWNEVLKKDEKTRNIQNLEVVNIVTHNNTIYHKLKSTNIVRNTNISILKQHLALTTTQTKRTLF